MKTTTTIQQERSNLLFSKYINLIFWLCTFNLSVVIIINFSIDPAGIYPSLSEKISPSDLVKQLVKSDHGVLIANDTWNERDIKKELALLPTKARCTIIGSSHAGQISSFGQTRSLSKTCTSLINLGVSGASLEDFLALSEITLQNKQSSKTIVFVIDPWSLNPNRDTRWLRYKDEYYKMKDRLFGKSKSETPVTDLSILHNLISREYFLRSVSLFFTKNQRKIELAQKFDQHIGLPTSVILPDGSRIYSQKKIRESYDQAVNGIDSYKIVKNKWYNEDSVEIFTKLINHLKRNGRNVIFVLTPYHPAVWKISEQSVVSAMIAMESKVNEIAKSNSILVVGSYHPDKIGCTANEFMDSMHAKRSCLNKLEKYTN